MSSERVTFGIKTSQTNLTYDEILATWLEAEDVPVFEHAWLWDHFIPLRGPVNGAALEAWTLLSALAAKTSRLRLGVMVTNNRARPPAVLAKMAATVDIVSGGRLDFGIGAGAGAVRDPDLSQVVHREYDAYGLDIVPAPETIAALGEACALIKRLWTEDEPFDFNGRHYQLKGAMCEPKPLQKPRPPIVIGSAGERLGLRVVAEHADIWNLPVRSNVDEFRHKTAVLDEHCAAIGRDPSEIRRSAQVLVAASAPAGGRPDLPSRFDPATTRELLVQLMRAGADHLVLAPIPPYPSVRWLADEIVEPALAAAGKA